MKTLLAIFVISLALLGASISDAQENESNICELAEAAFATLGNLVALEILFESLDFLYSGMSRKSWAEIQNLRRTVVLLQVPVYTSILACYYTYRSD